MEGGGVATGGGAVNGQIYEPSASAQHAGYIELPKPQVEVAVPMPGFCFCASGEAI